MNIMAFDPGGTIGVAACYNDNLLSVFPAQLNETNNHWVLFNFLSVENPDKIIYENFDNRGNIAADLIALEYIGVIRLWAQINNRPVTVQRPGDVKPLWTDEKLKTLNLFVKGQPHANDAIRHLLHYITVTLKNPFYLNELGRRAAKLK